jgi:hypothetical protein
MLYTQKVLQQIKDEMAILKRESYYEALKANIKQLRREMEI